MTVRLEATPTTTTMFPRLDKSTAATYNGHGTAGCSVFSPTEAAAVASGGVHTVDSYGAA